MACSAVRVSGHHARPCFGPESLCQYKPPSSSSVATQHYPLTISRHEAGQGVTVGEVSGGHPPPPRPVS